MRPPSGAWARERDSDLGPTLAQGSCRSSTPCSCRSKRCASGWSRLGSGCPERFDSGARISLVDGGRASANAFRSTAASFEDRGPQCALLVFADDATGRLIQLSFAESESRFHTWERLVPISIGTETGGIVQRQGEHLPRQSPRLRDDGERRHTVRSGPRRALHRHRHHLRPPSAGQGRVERALLTLQGRLVKELRLRDSSTMKDANWFLPEFVEDYNRRFAAVQLVTAG